MVRPVKISLPMSSEDARRLSVGTAVLISGTIVTGRDKIHRYLIEERPKSTEIPFSLPGTILYHCGPVVKKTDGGYRILSAGPTTSMRVERYEAEVLREYGIRGVMGKGGMGEKTRKALGELGAVYLQAAGGAAVYLADRIGRIAGVWRLEEFGPTEAMWALEVEDFPAVVTMDASGASLHDEIEELSRGRLSALLGG